MPLTNVYSVLRFNLNRDEHTLVIEAHHTRSNFVTDQVVYYYTQRLSNKTAYIRKGKSCAVCRVRIIE